MLSLQLTLVNFVFTVPVRPVPISHSVRVVNEKERERRAQNRGWWVWEVVYPSLVCEGSEGAVPPPQKFFLFFCLAMVHFGAFWAVVLMLV